MTNLRRLGELHIQAARARALHLFAFTGAVFPGEWTNAFQEIVSIDLVEFAFHARRVNQICSIDVGAKKSIQVLPFEISEGDPGNWVQRYDWALNRLVHATSFTFGNVHVDHRAIFTNAQSNISPAYVKVATDQREVETISIFGLVHCFLTEVIPEVKANHPDWSF